MCGFSLQLLSETFPILRIERNIITNVDTSSCTVPAIFCQIVTELKFSRQILEKSLHTKLHDNPSSGS